MQFILCILYTGDEATALHKADFAIEGRPILLGPVSAIHLRRLDALSVALQQDEEEEGRLSAAMRARVRHWACLWEPAIRWELVVACFAVMSWVLVRSAQM